MSKKVKVTVFRFTPGVDEGPHLQEFEVPVVPGTSVLNVLDYIYEELDSSLAYYSHSCCHQRVCGRCTLMVNGKAGLACETLVEEDIVVKPLPKRKIIRDLVYE